jgi:hypothetical protein
MREFKSASAALRLAMCLALTPITGWAQGTSAASVTGAVRDTSGAVLPGDNFGALSTGTRSIDDVQRHCQTENLYPGTWTHPRTNRLLFDAGYSLLIEDDSTFENPVPTAAIAHRSAQSGWRCPHRDPSRKSLLNRTSN